MSPLNRGPLLGPRAPPVGVWPPPPPRFGGRLPPPGMAPRMPPPPMNAVFGSIRQRLPPPRPGSLSRPGVPLPLFPPRGRRTALHAPSIVMRNGGPRGPRMQAWPRQILPPQGLPRMWPRFSMGNGHVKAKAMNDARKFSKLEELELKKPWMTDEIRSEIQKKNKLYVKAKKNKDAKEWNEFKDLRNKVTRMIRDAKNDYLIKHPEQANNYPNDDEPYDQRDENYISSDEESSYYCEVCDRDFPSEESFSQHKETHKLCGIDGCTFSAHPLLVEKHISMQHSTGLYQRMRNLTSPEDVEKWILERKRRYPTKANIELRKAAETEKKLRGEVIANKKEMTILPKAKKNSNFRDRKRRNRKRPAHKFTESVVPPTNLYRGLCPFPGTLSLREMESNDTDLENKAEIQSESKQAADNISDEEDVLCLPVNNVGINTPIMSLVANYGSDSNEDEGPIEIPINKMKLPNIQEHTEDITLPCNVQQEFHKPLEKVVASKVHEKNPNKQVKELTRHAFSTSNLQNVAKKRIHNPQRLQLLYKLLSRSIQHERNLICQCIKYIVDNNFFN